MQLNGKRQWAQLQNMKFHLKSQKIFFIVMVSQTLKQVGQRDCGPSICEDIQNPSG